MCLFLFFNLHNALATATGFAGRRPLPWLVCNVARAWGHLSLLKDSRKFSKMKISMAQYWVIHSERTWCLLQLPWKVPVSPDAWTLRSWWAIGRNPAFHTRPWSRPSFSQGRSPGRTPHIGHAWSQRPRTAHPSQRPGGYPGFAGWCICKQRKCSRSGWHSPNIYRSPVKENIIIIQGKSAVLIFEHFYGDCLSWIQGFWQSFCFNTSGRKN